mmetsp:Transcript_21373/g.47330  ORF Transcript_21373/g.47330 Transcript_21373/m.47330 type:complete len:214 (+) Transcript_21373:1330-1971(+)
MAFSLGRRVVSIAREPRPFCRSASTCSKVFAFLASLKSRPFLSPLPLAPLAPLPFPLSLPFASPLGSPLPLPLGPLMPAKLSNHPVALSRSASGRSLAAPFPSPFPLRWPSPLPESLPFADCFPPPFPADSLADFLPSAWAVALPPLSALAGRSATAFASSLVTLLSFSSEATADLSTHLAPAGIPRVQPRWQVTRPSITPCGPGNPAATRAV